MKKTKQRWLIPTILLVFMFILFAHSTMLSPISGNKDFNGGIVRLEDDKVCFEGFEGFKVVVSGCGKNVEYYNVKEIKVDFCKEITVKIYNSKNELVFVKSFVLNP
jgi:TATA-box binding protein (TBP) (component of TFIID and TFIIIB)